MPQIFTASADTRLRAALVLIVLATAMSAFIIGGYVDSSYATLTNWVRTQPVPFSHKHHVGELGIDCRYCHTSVESGPEAGLPPTQTCMTCHSQLWTGAPMLAPVRESLAKDKPLNWQRVAKVPDYVYFNHSIHIARGVACVTCHGRVDKMPLTKRAHAFQMQWCLDCHRNPASALRPPEQVTRMDWADWNKNPAHKDYGAKMVAKYGIEPSKLDDCDTCHR